MRSFIDSLAMLASKVHPPESRLAGTPLAADSTGTIWGGIALFAKGDGEQLMEWGLPSTSTPDQICGFCMANRTTMPYTDLRPSATWWATEIGTTVAFKERLKRPHQPLIDAPFFTFWFFRLDIMHLWDCKGLWPIMMGGVLCGSLYIKRSDLVLLCPRGCRPSMKGDWQFTAETMF